MAAQTQGIQQLLTAEKRAAEKVNEARKRKARRLKQAKDEAQAEIQKYREERETQFKDFENKYLSSRGDVAAKVAADTQADLVNMDKRVKTNTPQVIDALMELVLNVTPKVHENMTLRESMKA